MKCRWFSLMRGKTPSILTRGHVSSRPQSPVGQAQLPPYHFPQSPVVRPTSPLRPRAESPERPPQLPAIVPLPPMSMTVKRQKSGRIPIVLRVDAMTPVPESPLAPPLQSRPKNFSRPRIRPRPDSVTLGAQHPFPAPPQRPPVMGARLASGEPMAVSPDEPRDAHVTHHHHYNVPVTQVYRTEVRAASQPQRCTLGTQTEPVHVEPIDLSPPDPSTWRGWARLQARRLRPVFQFVWNAVLFILARVNFGIPVRIGGRDI